MFISSKCTRAPRAAAPLSFGCALWIACAAALPAMASTPAIPPRPVPADGRIVITDYGYRDWGPALVRYTIDPAAFPPASTRLVNDAGQEIPYQIDDAILRFVAAVPKGGTATYRLESGKPDPNLSSLKVSETSSGVEIANEFFTLRLPAAGRSDLKAPIPAAEAPGPITQWRPAQGTSMGGSRFVTDRKVSDYAFSLVRQGPACATYEARYQFQPAGEYVCRVTVIHGLDHANVVEEFDFGGITEGQDFLLLQLQKDFPATTIVKTVGLESKLRSGALADYTAKKLEAAANRPEPTVTSTPTAPQPEDGLVLLERMTAGGRWGSHIGMIQLLADAADDELPANRVAMVPMHTGAWRRAMAVTAWHHPDQGILAALPISVRPVTWYNETTDDISPFSTHEHDNGLAEGYGRRAWALAFGSTPQELQQTIGYIGLDAYKEWILDWADTTSASEYPRAWFTRDRVEQLRKSLEDHPDREVLSKFYVFSGKTEDAIRSAESAIRGLAQSNGGNWHVSGLSQYRQSQSYAVAVYADDALACPELPAELRTELRRVLAAAAYLISNPDFNPRGTGGHLGNNNMPINRTLALLYTAALLPDHPQYETWIRAARNFVEFKLGTYFAPDGVALEPPTYQLYGPLRFLDDGVTILHNIGQVDHAEYIARNLRYLANLSMPDPRYDGFRILPGMGNSGNVLESIYAVGMQSAARVDPQLAGLLQSVYQRAWPQPPLQRRIYNHIGHAFRYDPAIPASDEPLTTSVFPTYGVMFRAHFGSPDETAMLFRIGTNWGHWDSDPLNVVLYGQGAPLSPGTGYQYYSGVATANNAVYHNQLKVGRYDLPEVFGRVDNELRDYGFGDHADYAVASRYYPPEIFTDGGGEMHWNRHILFLKSREPAGPNYFVMRDTLPGGESRPSWWTWMNLETPDRIRVEGHPFSADDAPLNKALAQDEMATQRGQTVELLTEFGAQTWFWFDEARTFRPRLTFDYDIKYAGRIGLPRNAFPKLPTRETKTILEGVGEPGGDWFYVVYPRKDQQPAPSVTKLADGVLRIVTPESTDYVFVADQPITFEAHDVVFTGLAGAVRIFKDRVALTYNSGQGRIGYKGQVFTGPGPFERLIPLSGIKPGATAVTDTYEKKQQRIDIGQGIEVYGEAPFTAKLEGKTIRIQTDGRPRVIYVTQPDWIRWVRYRVDGKAWMALWTDYPASGWGTYKNTRLAALTVPGGSHQLEVEDLTYPDGWVRPFVPTIDSALIRQDTAE